MSRNTRRKPMSPEEIAQARARRQADMAVTEAERRHDPARWEEGGLSASRKATLEAKGAVVAVDLRGRMKEGAHKADVFARMLERGGLTREQHDAVRRLETDICERKGYGRAAPDGVVVDRSGDAAAVTQRMVDAGKRVDAALRLVGPPSSRLLASLLEPLVDGAEADWRAITARITGEREPHAQAALLRVAAQGLADVYSDVDRDYASRSRRPVAR